MRSAVLSCLAAALLFGASTPLAKLMLGDVGPLTLAGLLYLGAALAVLPFALRGDAAPLRRTRGERLRLAGSTLFGGILGPVFLLSGLRAVSAGTVSLWLNSEVVATMLLAWAFFREHVGGRALLAAVLILSAGILLALPEGAPPLRAGLFVGLACVCWGMDNNLTATIGGFTPPQTTLVKGLVAGVVNLLLGAMLEHVLPAGWLVVGALALGAVSYGLSIVLYITGAQQLGAARSQLLFSSGPFLGLLLSWILLGERVQVVQLAAVPLMVGGLALLLGARHEHAHEHAALSHTHRHRHDDGHHDHLHEPPVRGWHTHVHQHEARAHAHAHLPDLHHRHQHPEAP